MISLPGELVVSTKNGKFGNFNVAKLITSIGEFTLKDKMLEQIDAGNYQGVFVLKSIKSSAYTYGNRTIIECCAYVEDMQLTDYANFENPILSDHEDKEEANHNCKKIQQHKEIIEPEPQINSVSQFNSEPQINSVPQFNNELQINSIPQFNSVEVESNSDQELFGCLWPLGHEVKLDSSVERMTLRAQKERLIQLNYSFDFKSQTWRKNEPFF